MTNVTGYICALTGVVFSPRLPALGIGSDANSRAIEAAQIERRGRPPAAPPPPAIFFAREWNIRADQSTPNRSHSETGARRWRLYECTGALGEKMPEEWKEKEMK